MGRYGNYPKTVEDCKTISISRLKEWKYLTYGKRNGSIHWSINGVQNSSINIVVEFTDFEKSIILNYKTNGKDICYKVYLESLPSNLGKGEVLYFVCPLTKKLCRKLYFENSYFLHRTAFKGIMYSKQLESKKNRNLIKVLDKVFLSDEVYKQRYKKYFKTFYNGKPTKKYLKLQNKIDTANKFPSNYLEQMLLM